MGLDIYAGPLTRYYSHNWKTVVQQWAEENGYTFNRITPDGEPADNEEELSPAEIQAAVEDWRDQILAAISQPNQPHYTPWPEDNERPYYTDKPDWDAFGAMLLVAACHTYEEPVPLTVEKDWDFGEHPLIARLASDEERVWSLLRGATWWLPLTDSFLFQGPLPTDDQTMIATLGGLRKELEKLNQLAWQADEDTILGWADTEGYPVDGTVDSDGQYSKLSISVTISFAYFCPIAVVAPSATPSVLSGINRIQRWSQSKPLYLVFLLSSCQYIVFLWKGRGDIRNKHPFGHEAGCSPLPGSVNSGTRK